MEFYVFRTGPSRRKLLEVSIEDHHLTITGLDSLVRSLTEQGVTDIFSTQHYRFTADCTLVEAPAIFEALKARFERDSAYIVE